MSFSKGGRALKVSLLPVRPKILKNSPARLKMLSLARSQSFSVDVGPLGDLVFS